MSYSGDAAEQVVRMALEGAEVAAKITGEGAKQVAVMLYAILRDQKKTKGKTRLSSLLRSGKELKVFAVKDEDLRRFCTEAKKYGVLYCVLKDKNAGDGITDIMVRAEDASKINRIFERFNLATVELGSIRSEIERSREDAPEAAAPDGPDTPEAPGEVSVMAEDEVNGLLDELLGPAPPELETEVPAAERLDMEAEKDKAFLAALMQTEPAPEDGPNPTGARAAESPLSGPISDRSEQPAISEPSTSSRPSVRQELNEIRAEQEKRAGESMPDPQKSAEHKAPPRKRGRKKGYFETPRTPLSDADTPVLPKGKIKKVKER